MIVHTPPSILRSTRNRIDVLRREMARYPAGVPNAEYEDLVANFCGGVDEVFALDLAVRGEILDSPDNFNAEIPAQLEAAVADWHSLAVALRGVAPASAATGKADSKLRAATADLEAALSPSYEMNPGMDELCEAAIAEYGAGHSIAGLPDR